MYWDGSGVWKEMSPIEGDLVQRSFGYGLHVSNDGSTLAAGAPGCWGCWNTPNERGYAKVYDLISPVSTSLSRI